MGLKRNLTHWLGSQVKWKCVFVISITMTPCLSVICAAFLYFYFYFYFYFLLSKPMISSTEQKEKMQCNYFYWISQHIYMYVAQQCLILVKVRRYIIPVYVQQWRNPWQKIALLVLLMLISYKRQIKQSVI